MTDAITVVPQQSFANIPLTRSASGHVHSPFWTYDWRKYNPSGPYVIGSHFHSLREASISAFAYALGIQERDVMVTVRENKVSGETEWRCGTSYPIELPNVKHPQLSQADRMRKIESLVSDVERGGAIDI